MPISIVDIGVFFAVLLVGFAYVWKRGDLDWVRALGRERADANRCPPRSGVPQKKNEPSTVCRRPRAAAGIVSRRIGRSPAESMNQPTSYESL